MIEFLSMLVGICEERFNNEGECNCPFKSKGDSCLLSRHPRYFKINLIEGNLKKFGLELPDLPPQKKPKVSPRTVDYFNCKSFPGFEVAIKDRDIEQFSDMDKASEWLKDNLDKKPILTCPGENGAIIVYWERIKC